MSPMFVPGPVDVDPEVLAAQAQPMLPHRSDEFETIFHRAAEKAAQVFYTKSRVLLTASSGTGLQEAAVRNLVKDQVLVCVSGAFADRWYDVAQTNGKSPPGWSSPGVNLWIRTRSLTPSARAPMKHSWSYTTKPPPG